MDKFKKWFSQSGREDEDTENTACNRIPAILGITLTAIFTGVFIYAAATYFTNLNSPAPALISSHSPSQSPPNIYLCASESKPNSVWRRSKRAADKTRGGDLLIKRVARPLSHAPPVLSGTYDPPLYHDAGARCAWGHLTGRRVPNIEEVGVSYDSQQLGARACDDPEICKSVCLRMHKPDDPYLCNYFTWNREKKVALFYFLEPTIKWNLTQDARVETYFWQCKETQCTWFWRPRRIQPSLADMTASQLRSAHGLVAVSQCTDFATCQFACETRPSFRELQEQGQVSTNDVNLDDPTCDYVVMPSTDAKSQFSFLFSMRQSILKNTTYARSSTYDSFELICKDTPPPTVRSSPPSNVVVAAPPGQPRRTQKREVPKEILDSAKPGQTPGGETVELRECKRGGEKIDCSKLIKDTKFDAPCLQLSTVEARDHVSISIEAKRPVWFSVEQSGLDGMEEHVPLAPGRKHVIDMRLERDDESESSICGPPSVRGRSCAASCNDRLAIEACGCSISADPSMGIASLVSVPPCTDQQLKTCVMDQLRSDGFFDCMNECKKACSTWRPFDYLNAEESILPSEDYLTLDLRFAKPASAVQAEPMWSSKGTDQMMQVWAPALMIAMLSLALVAVIYVNKRR